MVLNDVGDIIGRRFIDLDGSPSLEVIIGIPKATPNQVNEYYCPYKISGFGHEVVRYAIGIDPIQALQLTLMMIGTDLYTSDEAQAGRLSWMGEIKKGDLGFPVPDVIKDVLP